MPKNKPGLPSMPKMPTVKKLSPLKQPAIANKFKPVITRIKGARTLSGLRKGIR